MTTITVEVPDELAAQLNIDAALLPKFVREAIEAKLAKQSESSAGEASRRPLYQEIVDFLLLDPQRSRLLTSRFLSQLRNGSKIYWNETARAS